MILLSQRKLTGKESGWRLRESRKLRWAVIVLLIAVTGTLVFVAYFEEASLLTILILAITALCGVTIVLVAIHYALYMQERLLDDVAEILYDKAVALENAKKSRTGEGGDSDALVPVEQPDIDFDDVGGMDDVKEDIRSAIVYPFEHPELYIKYGKKMGDGILLYGPPGCGKTYIARAAAGECGASFLTLKISDILSKWLGESEKNVRAAFEAAGEQPPAILFFDEIDAIGAKRGENLESHQKRLVNELLIQLDGFEGPKEGLLTLAATNEPWAVDPALRRPGRFSKLIYVPPPDHRARRAIFKLRSRNRPLADDIDFDRLATLTDGYSSADIDQIIEEAADEPLREALIGGNQRPISMADLEAVIMRRESSLLPWLKLAKRMMWHSDEREIFRELGATIERYLEQSNYMTKKRTRER